MKNENSQNLRDGSTLVSRQFEMNEFIGYGSRFLTLTVFSIGKFRDKIGDTSQNNEDDSEYEDEEDSPEDSKHGA